MVKITDKRNGKLVEMSLNYGMIAYGFGIVFLVIAANLGSNVLTCLGAFLMMAGSMQAKDAAGKVL